MQTTRQEILDILKRKERASVDELAKLLKLTSMCIRQHLSILERDDLVASREERQRLGRPKRVYSLTDEAEHLFPKSYHLLLDLILEEIERLDGREKLVLIFQRLAERMAKVHRDELSEKPLAQRVAKVAQILTDGGSLAEWEKCDGGYVLREHNCRYYHTALKHRSICSLELVFLRHLLGTDVELVECLLESGPRCTYLVKPAS
ncbi:MAG: helix-turn-helix domain-containing protein [Chloroflexi bacterium]|nr:helix-turn-helix domain-containing protein [Chloroflexota bacterium]